MRKAVLDVGSNSVLLTVAERTADGWEVVRETTRVTGLGAGTRTTGVLSEPAMTGTLAAIAEAFALAKSLGAERTVAAATMAVRLADNRDDFLRRAAEQETPVAVISGDQEAELGLWAVTDDPLFAGERRISIIDTGGHSTEIVTADRTDEGWEVGYRRSVPIGALGLRETSFSVPSPGPREILAATAQIDDEIGLAYRPGQAGTVVALGATPTNLVSIRETLREWQPDRVHGQWLDYEEVSKAVAMLCALDDAGRAAVVGIEPGRERTLHAGALILERFLQALRVLGCRVTVRGWRHALLDRELDRTPGVAS